MIRTPYFFEDGNDLLRFRDSLLAELRAGRMTRLNFSRQIKRACKRFREDRDAKEYYRRLSIEKARAAGVGV